MFGRRFFIMCLFAAVLVLSGCGTTYITDSTMDAAAEGRNEVKVAVGNTVKAVNTAVESVCEDLNLDQVSRGGDMLIGRYVFRTQQNEHITIFTRATSAISTEVRIQYDDNSDPRHPHDIITGLKEIKTIKIPVSIIGNSPIAVN